MAITRGKLRFVCVALIGILVLTTVPMDTIAASSSQIREEIKELESKADEIQAQMEALELQLKDNLDQMEQMVEQKNIIDQQIFLLDQQIANANEQIAAHSILIADNQDALDTAQQKLEQLNEAYRERIRAMEESGPISYWSVIFEADSFSDLLDRLNMIQEIAAADQQRLEELAAAAAAVADAQEALQTQKADMEVLKLQLQEDQNLLNMKRAEADALLRELVGKEAEYEALLAAAEEEEQRLLEEIAKKEEEFDEAKYREWLATYVPPTTGSGSANTSGWISPLTSYRLSSPFGMRIHPIYGDYRMHNGVDMSASQGTPIYAAKGGQVSIATYSSTAGYYVQINHGGGYSSVYMHMTNYVVNAGQYVAQGQLIGYVGNTGASKGAHLHFGISLNGTYVNPMDYIR